MSGWQHGPTARYNFSHSLLFCSESSSVVRIYPQAVPSFRQVWNKTKRHVFVLSNWILYCSSLETLLWQLSKPPRALFETSSSFPQRGASFTYPILKMGNLPGNLNTWPVSSQGFLHSLRLHCSFRSLNINYTCGRQRALGTAVG